MGIFCPSQIWWESGWTQSLLETSNRNTELNMRRLLPQLPKWLWPLYLKLSLLQLPPLENGFQQWFFSWLLVGNGLHVSFWIFFSRKSCLLATKIFVVLNKLLMHGLTYSRLPSLKHIYSKVRMIVLCLFIGHQEAALFYSGIIISGNVVAGMKDLKSHLIFLVLKSLGQRLNWYSWKETSIKFAFNGLAHWFWGY